MASRLGLKPWEREALEPVEIREMYDGMIWRHSRLVELFGVQTWLVRAMMTDKEKRDDVLACFPYYIPEEKP
jgi:hypothetical protein